MAKSLQYEYLPGLIVPGSYAMIGETRINHFHQSAEVHVYLYASEDARHQRLAPEEVDLHRPLKIIVLHPTIGEYQAYLEQPAKALAAACYQMATEVEEGGGASPRGLKNLLAEAKDI